MPRSATSSHGILLMQRKLSIITQEILSDWTKPSIHAMPYLYAMRKLSSINDRYGADTARNIVAYFLANAQTWRGAKARGIKAELKAMLKSTPR